MINEIVYVYNGKGVIKIRGSISDSYFYINNKPKIVSFFAEVGTVWRYLIGTEITEKVIENNYQYENLVATGKLNFSDKLQNQFGHILNLLANGEYQLQYGELSSDINYLELNFAEKPCYDFYGGLADIVLTQEYLDPTVVEKYKTNIKKGERPICVLYKLENSWSIFVIDGHHKLTAYAELKINPRVLLISKKENSTIEIEEGIEIMKNLGLTNTKIIDEFILEKKKKRYQTNFINFYQREIKLIK